MEHAKRCWASGSITFRNFDETMFKFSGTCKYVFAAVTGQFRVRIQNAVRMPIRRRQLAYIKSVEIEIGDNVISLLPDNVVLVR